MSYCEVVVNGNVSYRGYLESAAFGVYMNAVENGNGAMMLVDGFVWHSNVKA